MKVKQKIIGHKLITLIPKGYRQLRANIIRKKGDKFPCDGEWLETEMVGRRISPYNCIIYIRRKN